MIANSLSAERVEDRALAEDLKKGDRPAAQPGPDRQHLRRWWRGPGNAGRRGGPPFAPFRT